MAKSAMGMSDAIISKLAAADRKNGLPDGTMYSIMLQETGGQDKYINDPSTPHYSVGANGEKPKSSAFGPFGILKSTAADPGYGTKPLRGMGFDEQLDFASSYLGGRIKAAGGDIAKGIAGYGEGAKYANSVLGRIGGGAQYAMADTGGSGSGSGGGNVPALAMIPMQDAPQMVEIPEQQRPAIPRNAPAQNPWQEFLTASNEGQAVPTGNLEPQSIDYLNKVASGMPQEEAPTEEVLAAYGAGQQNNPQVVARIQQMLAQQELGRFDPNASALNQGATSSINAINAKLQA